MVIYSPYSRHFPSKLVCLGFWVQTTCKKNLEMISWKLQIFFWYLTFGGNFFVFKKMKKERNDYQKLDIRKKSTILKISSPNFLCKLSAPKNPSTPILEPIFGHMVNKLSLLITYLSPVANLKTHPLISLRNIQLHIRM